MSKNPIGARIIHRLTSVTGSTYNYAGSVPTVPIGDDHTLGWIQTDIYKGEIYINSKDDRAWTRTENGILEFIMEDKSTGFLPSRFMPNSTTGDFTINGNLTVTGLGGSGIQILSVNNDGTLTISSVVPGTGTVTSVKRGSGMYFSEITTEGTISMGTPADIHSGSSNVFINDINHTHKFIPAGQDSYIQFNSNGVLAASYNLRFDGDDLYLSNMSLSAATYGVYYDTLTGRLTYNYASLPSGSDSYIQFNSGNTLSSSSKFRYDGIDLYVSDMTLSGTSYNVFYNPITGRLTYNPITTGGSVTLVTAGNGMVFSDITTSGSVTLGTPTSITSSSVNAVFSDSHTHEFVSDGIFGSIQYKLNPLISSGITGNNKFIYDGTDLFISGMTSNTTTNLLYYDTNTGQLTYGIKPSSVSSISAGSGMSFSTITDTGLIIMGTPSTITPSSINNVFDDTHTHEINGFLALSGGTLLGTLIGTDLNLSGNITISGMTDDSSSANVVYYNNATGKLSFGIKPSGLLSGSVSFGIGTTTVDSYLVTAYNFAVYHYNVYNGISNLRAGSITIVNNNTTTKITESSTYDIGCTTGITFTADVFGGSVRLLVTSLTDSWICDWIKIIKPPADYAPFFNTNGATVSPITTFDRYVSKPTSEGNPFKIGNWVEGTSHSTIDSTSPLVYSTPAQFNIINNSLFDAIVYDADGTTPLATNIISLSGNSLVTTENITISVTNWALDSNRFKAKISVSIDINTILPNGGRFSVKLMHHNGTVYTFNQSDIFRDSETLTVNIGGTPTMTVVTPVIKHISGVHFYTTNTVWNIHLEEINNLNSNSYPSSYQMLIDGSQFFISNSIYVSGTDGDFVAGTWTNDSGSTGAIYDKLDWTINQIGTNWNGTGLNSTYITATANDWTTYPKYSNYYSYLIDTLVDDSDRHTESFKIENHLLFPRLYDDCTTAWDSELPLDNSNNGLQVIGNRLVYPQYNFTTYEPNILNQPDYTGLSGDKYYYRQFSTDGADVYSGILGFSDYNITEDDITNDIIKIELSVDKIIWLNFKYDESLNPTGCRVNGDTISLTLTNSINFSFNRLIPNYSNTMYLKITYSSSAMNKYIGELDITGNIHWV